MSTRVIGTLCIEDASVRKAFGVPAGVGVEADSRARIVEDC